MSNFESSNKGIGLFLQPPKRSCSWADTPSLSQASAARPLPFNAFVARLSEPLKEGLLQFKLHRCGILAKHPTNSTTITLGLPVDHSMIANNTIALVNCHSSIISCLFNRLLMINAAPSLSTARFVVVNVYVHVLEHVRLKNARLRRCFII